MKGVRVIHAESVIHAEPAHVTGVDIQLSLLSVVHEEPAVPLPATVADCRGPGICPVLRCKWNVLLHVTEVSSRAQTISVGARGGTGTGIGLATKRDRAGIVRMEDLDAIVDAVVALADQLPSTCTLDYVEDPDLMPGRENEEPGNPNVAHMTLNQVADVMGMSRERVRQIEMLAIRKTKRAEELAELEPGFVPLALVKQRRV